LTYKSKRQRRNNSETVREIRAVSVLVFFFILTKYLFPQTPSPLTAASFLSPPPAWPSCTAQCCLPHVGRSSRPHCQHGLRGRGGNERVIEVILPRDSHFPLLNQSCFPAEGWGRCCAMLGVGGVGGHFAAFGSGMVFRK